MAKKDLREFERLLVYSMGAIGDFRRGQDNVLFPHGLEALRKTMAAARAELQNSGLFEQSQKAVDLVTLVEASPAHDAEAENCLLLLARQLMETSGTNAAIRHQLRTKPSATLDDFKPDPDRWDAEDAGSV